MKPNDHNWQLSNLELSKRLKELGIKQESLYYWIQLRHIDSEYVSTVLWMKDRALGCKPRGVGEKIGVYSAFTVAELIIKLPEGYYVCQKCLWYKDKRIEINHIDNDLNKPLDYASAFAKMLIYLLENKLIKD